MTLMTHERLAICDFIKKEKLAIEASSGWQNHSGFKSNPRALVLDVDNTPSLQQVLQFITALNDKKTAAFRTLVRPAAGGLGTKYSQSYSINGIDDADIVVRLVGKEFTEINSVDVESKTVSIGPSIQIGDLNRRLYDNHQLTLSTSSLNPYISFMGLAANNGNGTGREQPCIAGLIQSMTVCLTNGRIVRLDKSHPDFETIKTASQGLFGFVLSLEITCIEAKKLSLVAEVMSLAELIEEINTGLFPRDPYVSVLIVPMYQPDELTNRCYRNVCVYRWHPVSLDTPDHNAPTYFTHLKQEVETSLYDCINLGEFLSAHPQFTPWFTRYIARGIAIGETTHRSVAPWYSSAHHQTGYPKAVEDIGFLFRVSPNCHEAVEALHRVFSQLSTQAERGEYPIISGIYLRYLKGTPAGRALSEADENRQICAFDMASHHEASGQPVFRKTMAEFFQKQLGAWPHLGKYIPDDYRFKTPDFVRALEQWHMENGLALERSMLLTPHYCKLLELPYEVAKRPTASTRSPHFFSGSQAETSTPAFSKIRASL